MTTSITAFPITAKQIAELTSASSAAGTDYLMAQQGATGTAYRKMTVAQVMGSGAAVVASNVTVNAATVPANGMYLRGTNTLGLAVNTGGEVQLTASALSPIGSGGNALGTTSLMWADLFLASGGVINFNAGNYTLTHSAGLLTASGNVGINTGTAVPLGRLHVSETSAAVSGVTSIVYSGGTQTTANTGHFIGLFSRPQYSAVSGNTLANLLGAYLNPENLSTGAVTAFAGVSSAPVNASTGAVANLYGFLAVPTNSGAGTVTNAYGLFVRIDNSNASGVITTAYGVFIPTPINSGTISTRYGIYQQDTAGSNVLGAPTTFGISGNTLAITANATSGTAIAIQGAGTGGMTFSSSGGVQLAVTETASAVNYVGIKGGATGNGVTVSAVGANTDINLILDAKGAGIISVLDSINLASGKVLQVNSTQVVGPRDTGWTTMTGTPDESTSYATSTVTLAQLAGRVMALQTALTTHGLIGA